MHLFIPLPHGSAHSYGVRLVSEACVFCGEAAEHVGSMGIVAVPICAVCWQQIAQYVRESDPCIHGALCRECLEEEQTIDR